MKRVKKFLAQNWFKLTILALIVGLFVAVQIDMIGWWSYVPGASFYVRENKLTGHWYVLDLKTGKYKRYKGRGCKE